MEIRSVDNQNVVKWEKLRMKKYRDEYGLFIVQQKHMIEEAISRGLLETLLILEGKENPFDHEAITVSEKRMKKYRDEYGLFIVQQRHMIEEAISRGLLETLLILEGTDNPFDHEAITVSEKVMKKLSGNVSLNDCLGICRIAEPELPVGTSYIVLENVQDPGNVGTIIRTACSFGYDAVILTGNCASLYNEKTIQSTQGALFHIPVLTMDFRDAAERLKAMGVRLFATTLSSASYLTDVSKCDRYALVFGNEGQGMSDEAVSLCDENIKIEMSGFESLNVAVACGICAHYFKNSLK